MRRSYELFFHPGEVTEIRAKGLRGKNPGWDGYAGGKEGVVSGYFDNAEDFEKAAGVVEQAGARAIYYSLNPVRRSCFSRAPNLLLGSPERGTKEDEIQCIRWMMIDIDPSRPPGIAASDEETAAAKDFAAGAAHWLEDEMGFFPGIRVSSGNGFHVLYRLPDCEITAENKAMIKCAIGTIEQRFPGAACKIDREAAKTTILGRIEGTTNRKGYSTPERPHRKVKIHGKYKALAEVPENSIESLRALAALYRDDTAPDIDRQDPVTAGSPGGDSASKRRYGYRDLGKFDAERYLGDHGQEISEIEPTAEGIRYKLSNCVFNPEHRGGEAAIFVSASGPISYYCFHKTCPGNAKHAWRLAKEIISGNKKLAPYYSNYDPDWNKHAGERAAKEKKKADPDYGKTAGELVAKSTKSPDFSNVLDIGVKETLLQTAVISMPSPDAPLPAPHQINPLAFYRHSPRGLTFTVSFLASYLERHLSPIRCTARNFWKYAGGVWSPLSDTRIAELTKQALGDWADKAKIDGAMDLLRAGTNMDEEDWPPPGEYINCRNGMIPVAKLPEAIRTPGGTSAERLLIPHDPSYGSRVQINCDYDPTAEPNRWMRFLQEIFPDRVGLDNRILSPGKTKIDLLQEFMGYVFWHDCSLETALFLYGSGANGKSIVLDLIEYLVGQKNATALPISRIEERFAAKALYGKMVDICPETSTERMSAEVFKAAVGGKLISVDQKHGPPLEFHPFCKFMIAMNQAPIVTDKTPAFIRRFIVLFFNRTFEPEERDLELGDKLQAEAPGVFCWCLEGLSRLMSQKKFSLTPDMEEDRRNFLGSLNPIFLFGDESCDFGKSYVSEPRTVFLKYQEWCQEGGYKPLSKNRFYEQLLLHNKGLHKRKHGNERLERFVGMKLKGSFLDEKSGDWRL